MPAADRTARARRGLARAADPERLSPGERAQVERELMRLASEPGTDERVRDWLGRLLGGDAPEHSAR